MVASALAEKLRDRVARFDFDARLSLNITASFGVAVALPATRPTRPSNADKAPLPRQVRGPQPRGKRQRQRAGLTFL